MPTNLLKVYPELLELDHLNSNDRDKSLKSVFKRDIEDNPDFAFRAKKINPTKGETDPMQLLFKHLTTCIYDKSDNHRGYEPQRSKRLHWIKYHIEERKSGDMLIFSVLDPAGKRTYILDNSENYVIVLEPYRNGLEYYLLTAYYLDGRNKEKILMKYERKLASLV